mgnify:CR=1 FL=1
MGRLSTHVLDTVNGRPAASVVGWSAAVAEAPAPPPPPLPPPP